MSWWTKNRRHVVSAVGAVAAAATAWFTGGASIGVYGAAMAGATAAAATEMGYEQRDQQKAAAEAAREAEAAAKTGEVAETQEATTTADTAGNEAYKRKQKQLAAANTTGRGGTMAASANLGGSGKLG